MLFVNLPVRDLPTARAFYEALGFSVQQHASDDQTAAIVLDDNVVVTLQTPQRFADLVAGEVGDPARATTAVHALTVGSRPDVDDLVARALAAGGRPWLPARDGESRYTASFADPDGNPWEVVWLDQLHVVN
jgi:uncharacterized protein